MKHAFAVVALTLFVVALAGPVVAQTQAPPADKLIVIYVSSSN